MKAFDILVVKGVIQRTTLATVMATLEPSGHASRLFLVLDTPGGDPNSGFRIMRYLDAQYDDISIIVPNMAMSTGTLMALGGDRVFMYHSSCLGPLDLQTEHPSDGSQISTLDIRDTWYTIYSITETVADRFVEKAISEYGINRSTALKLGYQHATEFVQPIMDKIDPYHLHSSYRASKLGAKYSLLLLQKRMLKEDQQRAQILSRHLANDYDTHGYAITLEAAQKLGVHAEDLSTLEEWKTIDAHYASASQGVLYIQVADDTEPQSETVAEGQQTGQKGGKSWKR